jgi:site-specific DNA recombinase
MSCGAAPMYRAVQKSDAFISKHPPRDGIGPRHVRRRAGQRRIAPDITQAILDGRQPHDLTADKLLAHSRLPLAWHEQRTALGFA